MRVLMPHLVNDNLFHIIGTQASKAFSKKKQKEKKKNTKIPKHAHIQQMRPRPVLKWHRPAAHVPVTMTQIPSGTKPGKPGVFFSAGGS